MARNIQWLADSSRVAGNPVLAAGNTGQTAGKNSQDMNKVSRSYNHGENNRLGCS